MFRHPLLALFVICLMLLNACGRDLASNTRHMTDTQALAELQGLPSEGSSDEATSEGLIALLNDLQASGKVQLHDGRYATAGSVDLSQLSNMLGLLQGGSGTSSLLGLATGLLNMNTATGGTPATTNSSLNSILALLNAVAPIIMMIAPQYAPFIQALIVIRPVVMTFISGFQKSASSAFLLYPAVMPA